MIWVIGGTSEVKKLLGQLEDFDDFLITFATESGREFIDSDRLIIDKMNHDKMLTFIDNNEIDLIIDLTHPYALEVSKNAKKAAAEMGIKYIRYVREKTEDIKDAIYLPSIEDTLKFLKSIEGICFFTTGSKNIGDFETVRGKRRFIYRVLPAIESIRECKKQGVTMKDIIAVLGPFSLELNKTMFHEYGADYVIMKDSGKEGGTYEKVKACKELGITPVIIVRNEEDGVNDLDSLIDIIRRLKQKG